jgi:hypothetical protein
MGDGTATRSAASTVCDKDVLLEVAWRVRCTLEDLEWAIVAADEARVMPQYQLRSQLLRSAALLRAVP